jgi:hypothetical protein
MGRSRCRWLSGRRHLSMLGCRSSRWGRRLGTLRGRCRGSRSSLGLLRSRRRGRSRRGRSRRSGTLVVIHSTIRISVNLCVGTREVKPLLPGGITIGRIRISSTSIIVTLWRSILRVRECLGSFDDRGDETGFNMPFDVTVQQPDTGVICAEA